MAAVRARLDTDTALRAVAHPHRLAAPHCPHRWPPPPRHESRLMGPGAAAGVCVHHVSRHVPRPTRTTPLNHCDDELRQAVALFRYGLLADIVHLPPGTPGVGERLRDKARHTYVIPGTRRTRVAAETLRDWLFAVPLMGGLKPCTRRAHRPRASPGACPPRSRAASLDPHPALSVNALIKTARERGSTTPSRRRPCTACSRAKDSSSR